MVRVTKDCVRLAPADWGGLLSLALTLSVLVATIIYQVHSLAVNSRVRMVRLETEIAHLKSDVSALKIDIRQLAKEGRP